MDNGHHGVTGQSVQKRVPKRVEFQLNGTDNVICLLRCLVEQIVKEVQWKKLLVVSMFVQVRPKLNMYLVCRNHRKNLVGNKFFLEQLKF